MRVLLLFEVAVEPYNGRSPLPLLLLLLLLLPRRLLTRITASEG